MEKLLLNLSELGAVAGMSGIALGVFLILFKKINLPRGTRKHLTLYMWLVWSLVPVGAVCYFVGPIRPSNISQIEDLVQDLLKAHDEQIQNIFSKWKSKYKYDDIAAQLFLQQWVRQSSSSDDQEMYKHFLKDNLVLNNTSRTSTENVINMEMIKIDSGSFTMGSPNGEIGREQDESPQTKISLDYTFWIGKYEVTQMEYNRIRNLVQTLPENPSVIRGNRSSWNLPDFGLVENRPVDNITWNEAMSFCEAMTRLAQNLPDGYEYRLPTETEWEYACRSGTTSPYFFGTNPFELSKFAWFKMNAGDRTLPVGTRLPNQWGLYDMYGNVMEWCYDWYSEKLPGGAVSNFFGPSSGQLKVIRGGGWESEDTRFFRSADRHGLQAEAKGWAYGFRVVLGPRINGR